MLKGSMGYRFNYGATYYGSDYGANSGWEERIGGEVEILPFVNYSGTKFVGSRGQTTNKITIGDPFTYMSYENDTELLPFAIPGVPHRDGGDRWRTAAAKISMAAWIYK